MDKCKIHEGNESDNVLYIEAKERWDANNFMKKWHTNKIFQSESDLFRQSSGKFIINLFGFLIQA